MPSKNNGTAQLRKMARKTAAEPLVHTGEITVHDTPIEGGDEPECTLTALLVRTPNGRDVLWINAFRVRTEQYRLIEWWARRQLGIGKFFATLWVDDLHAVGLFGSAA